MLACLKRDCRGAVVAWMAVAMPSLFGFAALALDYGTLLSQRQQMQAVADIAALEGARALPDEALARSRAEASLTRQLTGLDHDSEVAIGGYQSRTDDGGFRYPTGNRFAADADTARAVSVSVERAGLGILRGLVSEGTPRVGATAVAAQTPAFASLAIASSLATVDTQDSALLNGLFGSLLGTSVNLSAVAWQGLIDTDLQLLSLLERLAIEAGVSAVTPDEILDATLSLSDWLTLLGESLDAGEGLGALSDAAAAAAALSGDLAGDPLLRVGDVVDLQVGDTTYGVDPARTLVNALDLVRVLAELANGTNGLTTEVAVSLPGLGIDLRAYVVVAPEPIAIAPDGATVSTAQSRVFLDISAGLDTDSAPAVAAIVGSLLQVDIELLVDLAPATADVVALGCDAESGARYVDLDVTPGVARVGLGDYDDAALSAPGALDPDPAMLLQASLLGIPAVRVNGVADLEVSGSTSRERFLEGFSPPVERTVGTTGLVTGLGSDLIDDLELSLEVLPGLPLGVNLLLSGLIDTLLNSVMPALQSLLASLLGPLLDPVLDGLLQALGVQIGTADVAVGGLSCGEIRLVAS